ncbi:recombinase family protein [Chryseobacterium viscerum]|uniref:Recombinase family protein n=1 Tax=Chryseobacterium viscerum TaxID=1037377 RepID=A0A5N4BJL9_9FLAO|nr:recombinase family protein [Chryseobacterium viscerum]KAB1228619.1 recombinase family protein [Chryseobacterium viscerum]
MDNNFKNIHVGSLIQQKTTELNMDIDRICNFLKCTEDEVEKMFLEKDIGTDYLLKWSKLLEYDFFRLYTQHLILFSPATGNTANNTKKASQLPKFKKNIYTKEVIDFILELINSGEKTKQQVISEYRIPKTTLYKWLVKYGK